MHKRVRAHPYATKVDATGEVTLHAVTKTVTIPLDVRQSGSSVEAVGSLHVPVERLDMTASGVAGFVTVEDDPRLEFDLKLAQA